MTKPNHNKTIDKKPPANASGARIQSILFEPALGMRNHQLPQLTNLIFRIVARYVRH